MRYQCECEKVLDKMQIVRSEQFCHKATKKSKTRVVIVEVKK